MSGTVIEGFHSPDPDHIVGGVGRCDRCLRMRSREGEPYFGGQPELRRRGRALRKGAILANLIQYLYVYSMKVPCGTHLILPIIFFISNCPSNANAQCNIFLGFLAWSNEEYEYLNFLSQRNIK